MKGIHLNSRNPIAPDNYSGHISASCHTLEEVQEDKKTCDYVFLSPIFDSISKEGYSSKFTPEAIREAVKADIIDKKVIALGGIDEENILRVKDFGFGGAAIMGGLWSKFKTPCRLILIVFFLQNVCLTYINGITLQTNQGNISIYNERTITF